MKIPIKQWHSILKVSKYIIVRIKARHTYYVMHKTSYLTCEGIRVKYIASNNIHHNYHGVMPETRLERHFKNIILSNQEKFDDTKTRKTKERQYNYHRKDKLGSAQHYMYTVHRTLHVHGPQNITYTRSAEHYMYTIRRTLHVHSPQNSICTRSAEHYMYTED
jgi:hypothetical protein